MILHFAVARQDRVVIGLAERLIPEALFQLVHLVLEIEQRLEREARFVLHGAAAVRQPVLRQVAECQRIGLLDESVIGLVEPRKHLEQCGLAGAVRPAQADAIAVADLPRDVLEERFLAERFGDVLQLQHEGLRSCGLRASGSIVDATVEP